MCYVLFADLTVPAALLLLIKNTVYTFCKSTNCEPYNINIEIFGQKYCNTLFSPYCPALVRKRIRKINAQHLLTHYQEERCYAYGQQQPHLCMRIRFPNNICYLQKIPSTTADIQLNISNSFPSNTLKRKGCGETH